MSLRNSHDEKELPPQQTMMGRDDLELFFLQLIDLANLNEDFIQLAREQLERSASVENVENLARERNQPNQVQSNRPTASPSLPSSSGHFSPRNSSSSEAQHRASAQAENRGRRP